MPQKSRRIVVASKNPVKLRAARRGFERAWPDASFDVEGVGVDVDVPDQPMDDAVTRRGARLRVEAARGERPEAAFWIGMEGGIDAEGSADRLFAFAWVAVAAAGADRLGESRAANFELPPEVVRLVHGGMELGHADDAVFGREGSKHRSGAVGLLTHDEIDRAGLYAPAVVLALVPFLRPELY